jgi:hypothetical protein
VINNQAAQGQPRDKPDADSSDEAAIIDRLILRALTAAALVNLLGARPTRPSLDAIVDDAMHALSIQLPPELHGRARERLLSLMERKREDHSRRTAAQRSPGTVD